MPLVISLLRAINVGGNNMLPMSELKTVYAELGLTPTQTLLQSGNAVSALKKLPKLSTLAARIEDALEQAKGFRPRVLLRTPDELRELRDKNPFKAQARSAPTKLVVHFLDAAAKPNALKALRELHQGPEEYALGDRALYVYFPDGQGKSKLTAARLEKALGSTGTGRNWNTLEKLIAMADAFKTP